MTDKNLKKALELIDKEAFNEAEELLLKLRRNSQTPYINYLLGYIHHKNLSAYSFSENEDKFKGLKEDAKRFLGYVIDSGNPIEDAFWRLADIEENKKHAVRILRKGLEYFPNSTIIYEYLIIKSENSDIQLISKEIESKNIVSNSRKPDHTSLPLRLSTFPQASLRSRTVGFPESVKTQPVVVKGSMTNRVKNKLLSNYHESVARAAFLSRPRTLKTAAALLWRFSRPGILHVGIYK